MKWILRSSKNINKILEQHPEIKWISPFNKVLDFVNVETENGIFNVRIFDLTKGYTLGTRTSADRHVLFLKKLESKNIKINGKFLSKYKDVHTKMYIQTEFGIVKMFPDKLLKGHKQLITSAVNKTTYFINMARKTHGTKYNYSKTIYKYSLNPVTIICPEHGEFKQFPHEHINGSNCRKCAQKEVKKEGGYNKTLAERNKCKWSNKSAIVYLVKLFNEDECFYKIGITINSTNLRFMHIKCRNYNMQILKEINTSLYNAVYLEQELHMLLNKYKYIPKNKFDGYTECFSNINLLNVNS